MKNKRLTVLVLLTLLLATILVPVLSGCNNNVIVLKVYNAQDYIQHGEEESVLRDFEKYYLEKTGQKVRIQYDTFDTLERAYTIINKREADYDVMCPSDYIIEKMTFWLSLTKIKFLTFQIFRLTFWTETLTEATNTACLICGEL